MAEHSKKRAHKGQTRAVQHEAGPTGRIPPLGLNLTELEWARLRQIREDLGLSEEDKAILAGHGELNIKLPKKAHHDGARFPMPQQAADENAAEAMAREKRVAVTQCPFCPSNFSNPTALRFHLRSSHRPARDWTLANMNLWLFAAGYVWKFNQKQWYNLTRTDFDAVLNEIECLPPDERERAARTQKAYRLGKSKRGR